MTEMIGRLRVALGLETAAFEKGAKRAAAEIDTFGTKAEKAGFKIGTMGKAVVAGGLAIAGSQLAQTLKNVVEEGLNYAKALGQMSKLSNASVEEFQAAAFAAKSVGIESEKLADIYKDVNDKVGEFLSTGGGEMKDFFEKIAPKVGVTAEQFRNLSGPQALQLYVSTLERAGVNQQEMTFYMEALADEATALAPLLRNNGEGFRQMGEEARKAGIILTNDQISKAGETAKKIDALKTALSVRVSGVVIENSKAIGALAESMAKLLDKMLKLIDLGAKFANSPIGKFIGLGLSGSGTLGLGSDTYDRILGSAQTQKSTGGAAPVKTSPATSWGKTTTAPILGKSGGSVYRGPVTNFAGGGIMPSAAGTFASQAPGEGRSMEDRIWQQSDALAKVQGVLAEEAVQTADKVEVSNVRMAKSFGDMAQESLNALQSLASAVRGGGFLDILGAVIGMGMQLGSVGAFGKGVAAKINTPRVPAYAGGTSFHPGGLAMVGEKGPEIVNLPRGSSVYPNGTGPGGGATYIIKGNLLTPDFWQQINAGHAVAAQAGGEIGFRKTVTAGRRRLA